MKRPPFITGEIYHVYNRGVDKRKTFMNNKDHLRFVHDLYEFNDEAPAENIFYRAPSLHSYEVRLRKNGEKQRKLLVEIFVFCLMPNHFHLMLKQRVDGGITEFMRKLGTGYTNYFNQKYERSGVLFQGKFKAIHIAKQNHFIHLPLYIHLNPVELITPKWREKRNGDTKKIMRFLDNYRWSSYQDYTGKRNFPSVTQRAFLNDFFETPANHRKRIAEWLQELHLDFVQGITLE
jgi:putative transposase